MKTLFLIITIACYSLSIENLLAEESASGYFSKCNNLTLDKKLRSGFLPSVKEGDTEGASVVEINGRLYLIAFGSTLIKNKKGSGEKLRGLKVSKAKAYKALTQFLHGMKLKAEQKIKTEVTVITTGTKTKMTTKEYASETIYSQTKGFIRTLPKVGTWSDSDGSFYTALAGELAEKYQPKKKK